MSAPVEADLNQVIASAVNARIETAVIEALSGDAVMGRYVAAALGQVIEVPKAGSSYEKRKTTYLKHTIDKALQEATKAAVARVLAEEAPALEEAVRKELRRNIAAVAEQLVGSVKKSAESSYGITVELKMPRN